MGSAAGRPTAVCAIDQARSGEQGWRAILRQGLDNLRDRIDEETTPRLAATGDDPWALRDNYVHHLLATEGFDVPDPFSGVSATPVRALLEIQRHRLMMFTSCGWFFDDPGGLETVQILRYAVRACELLSESGGPDLYPALCEDLAGLRSRDPKAPDGRAILELKVRR